MLDQLQESGLLTWQWDYENSTAIYWITETGKRRRKLGTKQAEQVATRLCAQDGIIWLPVPHPGGEDQLSETLRKIDQLRGIQTAEASASPQHGSIQAEPFDLNAHPTLEHHLHDEPTDNRSAQTYRVARLGIDLGLNDGQIKWLLSQYPPFLDKYTRRHDADRELDRVISRARDDASR
jgi:hypothetical protein